MLLIFFFFLILKPLNTINYLQSQIMVCKEASAVSLEQKIIPFTVSVIQSGVTIFMPGCLKAHSNLA